jgi:hypothetical protein
MNQSAGRKLKKAYQISMLLFMNEIRIQKSFAEVYFPADCDIYP